MTNSDSDPAGSKAQVNALCFDYQLSPSEYSDDIAEKPHRYSPMSAWCSCGVPKAPINSLTEFY